MKALKLKDAYSRKEIHQIFSPETTFTPQAGAKRDPLAVREGFF